MYIRRVRTQAIVALAAACWVSAVSAQGLGRLEIHAIPSVTVSNEQFLIGDRYGKPVIIGGELRLPKGLGEKFATVILIHGSGGFQLPRIGGRRNLTQSGLRRLSWTPSPDAASSIPIRINRSWTPLP